MCFPSCSLHAHAKRFLEWVQDATEGKVGVVGVSTTEDGRLTMMTEDANQMIGKKPDMQQMYKGS